MKFFFKWSLTAMSCGLLRVAAELVPERACLMRGLSEFFLREEAGVCVGWLVVWLLFGWLVGWFVLCGTF